MALVHGKSETAYDVDMFPLAVSLTCEECLLEAWERMTDGGVNGANAVPFSEWYWKVARSITYAEWTHKYAQPS